MLLNTFHSNFFLKYYFSFKEKQHDVTEQFTPEKRITQPRKEFTHAEQKTTLTSIFFRFYFHMRNPSTANHQVIFLKQVKTQTSS